MIQTLGTGRPPVHSILNPVAALFYFRLTRFASYKVRKDCLRIRARRCILTPISRCPGSVGVAFPRRFASMDGPELKSRDRGVAEAHAPFLLGRALARVKLDHLPVQHYPHRRFARSRHSLVMGGGVRDL